MDQNVTQPLKILILEDNIFDADMIQRLLKKEKLNCQFKVAMDKNAFLQAFEDFSPDVILSDNSLPQFNSSDALKFAQQKLPGIPFILVTGTVSEEFAASIIKSGADDYILKDRMAKLPAAIDAALKKRRLEDAVKSSEEMRKLIMESALEAIVCLDITGAITVWNTQAKKMFGWDEEEIIGRKFHETIIPERYRQSNVTGFSHYLKTGESPILNRSVEFTALNHNGSEFPIELSVVPIKQNGNYFLCAFIRNITERKEAEEKLLQEQYLMQTLMKNLPDHIYFKDNESRFLRISQSQGETFGLSDPLQAVGKTDFDFFSNEHASAAFNDEKTIRLTGKTVSKEETQTWPDRPNNYVSTTKMPFRNKEGVIIGTFGISTDITDRKNAELQKEFDSNNLKALINNTNDLMWSVDKDLKLITCNDSFNQVITATSGKPLVIGDNVLSPQFTKEQVARYRLLYKRALSGEAFTIVDHFEYPVEFWSEVSFYPIRKGDTIVGTACFSHDITERKKSEEALRVMAQEILDQKVLEQKKITRAIIKAQEMERNHIGQELHDNVNQILAVTRMYMTMAGKDDEKVKDALRHPLELIDNSINEIRLLSSKQVTPLKDINLEELLQSLLDNLSKNTEIKSTLVYKVINNAIHDDLKLNIYRIIQEQVNNIMKHAAPKNVSVIVEASGKAINIVVKDDGKGFNTSNKRKGIGISNMINRIKSFDGDVSIKSSIGNGCSVQIKIPY